MRQKMIELQGEILHLTAAEYAFFSSSHAKFAKINHTLGHKTQLKKSKGVEIIQSMFSDHSVIKLEIKNREIAGKSHKYLVLNSTLLNNIWIQK